MASEKTKANIQYLRIVNMLKQLKKDGFITKDEYSRAKDYYRKMTGADMVILDDKGLDKGFSMKL